METLFIALGSLVLYLIAYNTYGKWLGRKIFKLDPEAPVPSVALNDDRDYVPTKKSIICLILRINRRRSLPVNLSRSSND